MGTYYGRQKLIKNLQTLIDLAHTTGYYQGKMETLKLPITKADYQEYSKLNADAISSRNALQDTILAQIESIINLNKE